MAPQAVVLDVDRVADDHVEPRMVVVQYSGGNPYEGSDRNRSRPWWGSRDTKSDKDGVDC